MTVNFIQANLDVVVSVEQLAQASNMIELTDSHALLFPVTVSAYDDGQDHQLLLVAGWTERISDWLSRSHL